MGKRHLRILLVEDSPADADLLCEGLSELHPGFEVARAQRLDEALEYLRQAHVDAVLLDLGLPDSMGLPTLERTIDAAPHLPVVVLTGLEDEAIGIEALRKGAQDYLVKGHTTPRMLVRAIDYATERKRLETALLESEERFRAAQELSLDAFTILAAVRDASGVIMDFRWEYLNPEAGRILRHTPAELVGQRLLEVLPGNKANSDLFDRYVRVVETGEPHDYELWYEAESIRGWFRNMTVKLGDGVAVCFADITERKRMEAELRRAKEAAEAANVAKGRFLANVSHELRTPMNAILGMVDLALPRQVDPAARDFLQTARESADLLLALLNDLLDCAKIESGKLELQSAPFSLYRVLDQITRVLAVRASEKGICFSCRTTADVPDGVVGDQVRLRQILLNLAGNGIKFTERGEVTVSVRVSAGPLAGEGKGVSGAGESPHPDPLPKAEADVILEFAVRDTGIGIPHAGLERIFRPFAQADPSTTRRFGGTGLGLTISSSLVAMMGGRIWVESEPGRGSTFYFTVRLPLAKELPPEPETSDVLAAAPAKLRILLVEDNPANQKLAAYTLRERGHTVDVAGDGRQALCMAQESRHDVILMDVQMPGMDGLEATKAIRAREDGRRRVPIIAMTAHAMKGDRERCLAAGMDGYLSKPIDGREMIALVESLAAGSSAATADSASSLPASAEPVPPPGAAVFDPELALRRCLNSQDMLAAMIQCFFDDGESLFPQMRAALQNGDLAEFGRLGHRLKGTAVYLGAQPASEAARAVEKFERLGGEKAEAEEALRALEQQCEVLKSALAAYRAATCPPQAD